MYQKAWTSSLLRYYLYLTLHPAKKLRSGFTLERKSQPRTRGSPPPTLLAGHTTLLSTARNTSHTTSRNVPYWFSSAARDPATGVVWMISWGPLKHGNRFQTAVNLYPEPFATTSRYLDSQIVKPMVLSVSQERSSVRQATLPALLRSGHTAGGSCPR